MIVSAVYSELHSRLNHLVNYSSQLIFVSSDTIAEQQKTLEAFIADQDENTEVAFLTAARSEPITTYRRQLCRQLLGQVAGSFVRPLNELLVSLNHHDGPVLIGITQAHHLTNEFLQELWDLVLQSRFAANKQHLNIVLFGESVWAEKAQAWLPAKNTATPLLLSSESVHAPTSELDRMIAQKRAAFQARIEKRLHNQEQPTVKISLIRKPWFNGLMIVCFVIIFGGLLAWQYPERMERLLGLSTIESDSAPALSLPEPLIAEKTSAVLETSVADIKPLRPVQIEDERPSTKSIDSEKPHTLDTVQTTSSLTEELLVTKWESTSETKESKRESEPTNVMNQSTPLSSNNTESDMSNAMPLSPISVENEDRIPDIRDDQFLIQISGMADSQLAQDFLRDHDLSNNVWTYSTQRFGGEWVVILYSEVYDSIESARAAIVSLPPFPKQSEPFVKSGKQINDERGQ